MLNSLVHRRQFVLGPHAVTPNAGWQSIRLEHDLVLSHCPKLPITRVVDRRGCEWVLLGVAVQVDPNRPSPEEGLHDNSTGNISTVYESWAGRWLLIGDSTIHLDAGGLLGCFYRLASGAAGAQQLWMSSSLALLANLAGVEVPPGEPRRLLVGNGFEWDPPPRTGYVGIRKVLPSQTLNPVSGEIRSRRIALRAPSALTYDQVLDELGDSLVTAIRNVQGRRWLALSAGYDSRLLLAASQAAGVPFSTYTQTFPTMTDADRTVPPLLAALAGIDHKIVEPAEEDRSLLTVFDMHCCGQYVDADRRFFARRQWHWTAPGDVMVRGGGFEVASCFYWNRLPPRPQTADSLLRAFRATPSPEYVRSSIADCLDWISRTPVDGQDWRDRFYLESRLGGWASAGQQAFDIIEGTMFLPVNSARIHALLFAVPEEKRRTKQHNVDLIRRLSPELLKYPINKPDGFTRRTDRRLRRLAALLREEGIASTVHQVSEAIKHRLKRGQDVS